MTNDSRPPTNRQVLIGLPGTGKTTYLAALWHVVNSVDVPGTLRLAMLHGNRRYLNEIRNDWLGCNQLPRTVLGVEAGVSMLLERLEDKQTTEVWLPDLSGETFEAHLRDRTWSFDFDQSVMEATGALLFIHPGRIVEPVGISEANRLLGELSEPKAESWQTEHGPVEPWSFDFAPTQVKVCELMQFIMLRRGSASNLRVAVIVSAWDLVQDTYETPEKLVSARLPLLSQFLMANREQLPCRYFGISAQGGELPKDSERLREVTRPSERIIVISDEQLSHDVTLPVKWLMSW